MPVNIKLLADLTESLLAAVLLDKGLAFVGKFCEVCLFPRLPQTTQVCCQQPACTNRVARHNELSLCCVNTARVWLLLSVSCVRMNIYVSCLVYKTVLSSFPWQQEEGTAMDAKTTLSRKLGLELRKQGLPWEPLHYSYVENVVVWHTHVE